MEVWVKKSPDIKYDNFCTLLDYKIYLQMCD